VQSIRNWWKQLVDTTRGLVAPSEGEWMRRLGDSLTEAERTDAEYRGVMGALQRQHDIAARRGDARTLARAVWAMALVELHVGHDDLAEHHARVGLPLLASAEPIVQRLATANVLQRMLDDGGPEAWTKAREALFRDAVDVLAALVPSWSLSLMAGVAAALLDAERHDECIAVCDAAFALRNATVGNPYRANAAGDLAELEQDGEDRGGLIYMIGVRARAHERVTGFERARDSVRQAVAALGGVSDPEARTIAWLRGYLAYREGRYAEAERELGFALGPDVDLLSHHFARDAALDALGWTYLEMGMLAEAAGVAKRMGELAAKSPQPASLLAKVELARGNLRLAHECATRALAAAAASEGISWLERRNADSAAATAALVIAEVASLGGDPQAARAHASAALSRGRFAYPAGDLALLDAITAMARAEAECEGEDAEVLFREALALRCRPDHPKRARTLRAYAVFLRAADRADEASAAEAEAEAVAWRAGSA
jgi:hypothetical protein